MNLSEATYYLNQSFIARPKRNTRTLLAVSTDGLWPKWCVMVAFFRVFSQAKIPCGYFKPSSKSSRMIPFSGFHSLSSKATYGLRSNNQQFISRSRSHNHW